MGREHFVSDAFHPWNFGGQRNERLAFGRAASEAR